MSLLHNTIDRRRSVGTLAALAISIAIVLTPRPAFAQADELDHLALATRLFQDGHHDRAKAALEVVDPALPGLDHQRYHTLLGLLSLEADAFASAAREFDAAIKYQLRSVDGGARRADPALLLHLAQSYFGLKDWLRVLETLRRAAGALDAEPAIHLMRAEAHWELSEPGAALGVLAAAARRFPKRTEPMRQQLLYLAELGLFQQVMDLADGYLSRSDVGANDYLAIGEALRRAKRGGEASQILEGAHLRFPYDAQLLLALAHVYLDQDRPLSAAMLLQDAAHLDPKFTIEAAELYKRAKRYERALFLNARVADAKAKMKQRLSILLEMGRFALVAGMAPSLSRLGLLEDDKVRYALSYGLYRVGDFVAAEQHLRAITDPGLFASAAALRKAMASCRASGWECT